VRRHDPTLARREGEMLHVRRAVQADVRRRGHVDIAPP
jgi:hypothetical protein